MIKEIKRIYQKNKEIINYIIVGGLTTIVSIGSYAFLRLLINNWYFNTIVSWMCAVTFSYFANRKYVFESKNSNIILEFFKFVSCRLLTLLIEFITMWLLIDVLKLNDMISKILVQFIILVLNYMFSKILVFSKKIGYKKNA